MVEQSFEAILSGVAAKHEDKSWRSVLNRASGGMMSAIGMRRGPKLAPSSTPASVARAAYEDELGEEDFSDFDEPEAREGPEPRKAEQARSEEPAKTASGVAAKVEAAYAKDRQDEAPAGAPSIDPGDIARELNIGAATCLKDLLDARRTFARANHPDRMAMAYRTQSTIRMQVANRLVDDAIAKMSGQRMR